MDELETRLRTEFQPEIGGLRSEIGGLGSLTESLRFETGSLRTVMNRGFDRIERKIDRIITRPREERSRNREDIEYLQQRACRLGGA
jgi:hypothetical protein